MSATRNHFLPSAAAGVNATLVTTGLREVDRLTGYNASASGRWIKFYDKVAIPSEADTPSAVYYIPPTTPFSLEVDLIFGVGIGYRITTGSANGDTGALTAGDILGLNLSYN